MRRRSRAGGEPVKTRRRKTAARKRGNAPKAERGRSASVIGQETEVARLTRQLHEAQEQQTATAEVLKIISTSPTKLQPVLEVVARSAARFCEADDVTIFELDGQDLRIAAHCGAVPHLGILEIGFRFPCTRGSVAGRTVLERRPVHVSDLQAEAEDFPEGSALARRLGHRTIAGVPLLREGVAVGTIQLRRTEVNPFTDKQIALLGTFAAQAVIAIENARLLNELRESLDRQTATSEVLSVISSSPGELGAVFDAMLVNATRLCEARFGILLLWEGDAFRTVALHNAPPAFVEDRRREPIIRPASVTSLGRLVATKQVDHVADMRAEKGYVDGHPGPVSIVELAGARTVINVPMLKERELIGCIALYRQEVRPFTDKQIALLQNFAAQAVIAIENARLLNELRESLERQTATSEVLKVISTSPGDLQPVFSAILVSAARLCDASFGNFYRRDDDTLRLVATYNTPVAFAEARSRSPLRLDQNNPIADMLAAKIVLHIEDLARDERYTNRRDPTIVAGVELGGVRTFVAVPMLKDNEPIGALVVYRQEVHPFTDKQIELVKNFAAQAVIAIENTRLLNELRQSLDQQTATAEVLGVISSSPGDLQPVFDNMLRNAVRICDAKFGLLVRFDGEAFHMAAEVDLPPDYAEFEKRRGPFLPPAGALLDRVMKTKRVSYTADMAADATPGSPARLGGARSAVAVPLLKDDQLIGAMFVYRQDVRPFTDKQITLLQNFAAQAVIAIENTRLLNELRESLQQQTATSDVLRVISSSPSDLAPVFQTMLANATRLCDATFGLLLLYEGDWRFRVVAMSNVPPAFAELRQREPIFEVSPQTGLGRAVAIKDVVHVADYAEEAIYKEQRHPAAVALGELGGARTFLVVPMLKDKEIAGAIAIYRQQVRPFADKQIELVKNFAAQAVIAIENTRLLNELRQRTTDLTESLEQQTATSNVLRVISSSPGTLEPVFETMLKNAVRICGAKFGNLWLREGDSFYIGATHGAPPAYADYLRRERVVRADPKFGLGQVILTKQAYQVADISVEPTHKTRIATIELAGARTLIGVPMLKDDEVIGCIVIYRQEVRPFTDKQIELVKNFAAQAVIAIENTRLLNELRQSLEQQTATADVLRVISSSPGELEPVFQAMLESAVRVCDAKFGILFRYDNEAFEPVAHFGVTPEYAEFMRQRGSFQPPAGTGLDHLLRTKDVFHIADELAEPIPGPPAKFGGARSRIAVPMLKDEVLIGAIVIYRQEVRPFTDKQIELVRNFAAQAVIAIENTRLLNELRQSLEQQTATADVLRVISSSPGELEPVFQAILQNATTLCEARFGGLTLCEGDAVRIRALHNAPSGFAEFATRGPFHPGPKVPLGRAIRTKQIVHVADIREDESYLERDPLAVAGAELGGYRTILIVPMLKEDKLSGAIAIFRQEVRPFTDKQIALVQNFASQAVIAIENARLLNELRQSLQQQTATADVLKIISRSTFDLKAVLNTLVNQPLAFAKRTWHRSHGRLARSSIMSRRTAIPGISRNFCNAIRLPPGAAPAPAAPCSKARPFTSPTFWRTQNTPSSKARR